MRAATANGRGTNDAALEQLLEVLERERLTPLEMRILLRAADRETTNRDIAGSTEQPPSRIGRASTRLVARGLLRRHRRAGHPLKLTLTATRAGTSALQRISTALGECAANATQIGPPATQRHVVVGYDGSPASKRALAQGALAATPEGRLSIVSVRQRSPSIGLDPEPFVELGEEPSRWLTEARSLLAGATIGEVQTLAREGNPALEIVDIARDAKVDLIVVGRSGGRFMSRAIFGSTAARVAELAHCDTLVVA
jgi:nucleotide-binding universal stress UspA family protein